jgi:hypothetical protein
VSGPELRVAQTPERGLIYRLGRRPDAWALPPWEYAGPDGTFDNRYDDPLGQYRVLYASTQRFGAFVETLARFRPDVAVVAELQAIVADDPRDAQHPPTLPAGLVPGEWLATRCVGVAALGGGAAGVAAARGGVFADVAHSDSVAHLRGALAKRLAHYGLDDFDAGDLRARAPRALTQEISRYVYDQGFAGLRYPSRLGDDIVNWAIFEPPMLASVVERAQGLRADDPDLRRALGTLGLSLRADGEGRRPGGR